jgi:hypothetical protein
VPLKVVTHSRHRVCKQGGRALAAAGSVRWQRLDAPLSESGIVIRREVVERACAGDADLWSRVVGSGAYETQMMDFPRLHLGF